ncbi:MAG: ribonuclease E inhibitor RraB [Pseudomonadota bacterium]
MSHNYESQRRDTYASFKDIQGIRLPKEAVIDFLFFIEELDADWVALEKALQKEGFRTRRDTDGETLVASYGPMPVTPEAIWVQERIATGIALKFDFYPDGWELAE